jgi:hypothetical protein
MEGRQIKAVDNEKKYRVMVQRIIDQTSIPHLI